MIFIEILLIQTHGLFPEKQKLILKHWIPSTPSRNVIFTLKHLLSTYCVSGTVLGTGHLGWRTQVRHPREEKLILQEAGAHLKWEGAEKFSRVGDSGWGWWDEEKCIILHNSNLTQSVVSDRGWKVARMWSAKKQFCPPSKLELMGIPKSEWSCYWASRLP